MKQCSICKEDKLLLEFNRHVNMKDGYFKMCKDCQKVINKFYYNKRKSEVDKTTKGYIKRNNFWNRFPEKLQAIYAIKNFKKNEGFHLHHWSYNEEHYKDIIELTASRHMKVHKRMIYDPERMMYRDLNGILLDTKEAHLEYINSLS